VITTGQGDGISNSISTPFIIVIPKITQLEILHAFSLPQMPQTVKFPILCFETLTTVKAFKIKII